MNKNAARRARDTVEATGTVPVAWTVAGTDPSGGAGIQADLKTFHALGVYGGSAITAVIAQNSLGVRRVRPVDAGLLKAQLDALAEDLPPSAVKIGMLGGAPAVRCVARTLADRRAFVVCDPVLRSSSGRGFLDAVGCRALRDALFPRLDLITPNLNEAARLMALRVDTPAGMMAAADALRAAGVRSVLVKGGHLQGPWRADFYADARLRFWLVSPAIEARGSHGTGCTLSSAVAAFVARGKSPCDAVCLAKAYVNQGLRLSPGLGRGNGPLAHAGWPARAGDYPWIVFSEGGDWLREFAPTLRHGGKKSDLSDPSDRSDPSDKSRISALHAGARSGGPTVFRLCPSDF